MDLIFNFYKAYFILEEVIAAGELQETSKNSILRVIGQQDIMFENPNDLKHEIWSSPTNKTNISKWFAFQIFY